MTDRPLHRCLVPGCGLESWEPFCHGHWYAIGAATRSEIYRLRTVLKRVPVGGWYGRRAEMRREKLGDLLRQTYRQALKEIAAAAPQPIDPPRAAADVHGNPSRTAPRGVANKTDRGRMTEDSDFTGLEF